MGFYWDFQPYGRLENLGRLKGDTWTYDKEEVLLSRTSRGLLVGHPPFICSSKSVSVQLVEELPRCLLVLVSCRNKIRWFFCLTEEGFNGYCPMCLTSNCALGSFFFFFFYDSKMWFCIRVFNQANKNKTCLLGRGVLYNVHARKDIGGSKWYHNIS
jgi:hypothetical protein